MKVEVIILVKCNEKTERVQKYEACTRIEKEIQSIKGVQNASYTGNLDADITVFANWEETDIPEYVTQIQALPGVEKATAKILIPV